jgi:cytochrome P450
MTHQSVPFAQGRPLLGHFRKFKNDVLGTLKAISTHGPVTRFKLLWADNYLVSDPDLADEVYLNKSGALIKNPHFWNRHRDVFGNSLLLSDGEHWKTARKAVSPALRKDAVSRYFDESLEIVDREIDALSNVVPDLRQTMLNITSRVATNALFGAEIPTEDVSGALQIIEDQFSRRMKRPFSVQDLLPTPSNLRFRKALADIDRQMCTAIHEARQTDHRTALSSLAVAASLERLSDADLRDEAVTLFLAGHETSAAAVTFTLCLLANHPEDFRAVTQEARAFWSSPTVTLADLLLCPLLMGAIKESLRLLPPAFIFGRLTSSDLSLGPYSIPAQKTLVISPYVLGQNPALFTSPERFSPQRWTPAFESSLPRAAFSPFGGGPRICPGDHFAYLQVALLLSRLLARRAPAFPSTPGLAVRPWITLLPAAPIPVRFDVQ